MQKKVQLYIFTVISKIYKFYNSIIAAAQASRILSTLKEDEQLAEVIKTHIL